MRAEPKLGAVALGAPVTVSSELLLGFRQRVRSAPLGLGGASNKNGSGELVSGRESSFESCCMNAHLRTSHDRCWPSPSAKTSVSYQIICTHKEFSLP